MLSKGVSDTIFWDFVMTRSGIEPWSPGPLANMIYNTYKKHFIEINDIALLVKYMY